MKIKTVASDGSLSDTPCTAEAIDRVVSGVYSLNSESLTWFRDLFRRTIQGTLNVSSLAVASGELRVLWIWPLIQREGLGVVSVETGKLTELNPPGQIAGVAEWLRDNRIS